MKQIVIASSLEEVLYRSLETTPDRCELYCDQERRVCNKACTGTGTNNASSTDESDILF